MLVSPTIQHLHGRLRSITGTDPAAGVEISETVPARRRWRILAITFTFVTDITEANRYVLLEATDGTNIFFRTIAITPQAASLSTHYSYGHTMNAELIAVLRRTYSFPPLLLPAGFVIQTTTFDLKAGDNYSAPQLLVEEWIDP